MRVQYWLRMKYMKYLSQLKSRFKKYFFTFNLFYNHNLYNIFLHLINFVYNLFAFIFWIDAITSAIKFLFINTTNIFSIAINKSAKTCIKISTVWQYFRCKILDFHFWTNFKGMLIRITTFPTTLHVRSDSGATTKSATPFVEFVGPS